MEVRVRIPTQLRELVSGAAVVDVTVSAADDQTTVGAVLDSLAGQHPPLERRIRDELGSARTHVNLFVGADNVRDRDGLATLIRDGEELSVIPAVSGG
jgi:molybdopterin converting factor small subunit